MASKFDKHMASRAAPVQPMTTYDEEEFVESEAEAWSLRKLKAQTAKLEAETKAKELTLEIQRGQYLPKDEVEVWATTVVSNFSAALQRVPKRLASSLVGLTAQQISVRLDKELKRVVEDLRKGLEEVQSDDE